MTIDRRHDQVTINLPTIKPDDWVDADARMFLTCFEILGSFVEDELGKAEDGPSYRGYRLHSAGGFDEKAIDLWLWFTETGRETWGNSEEADAKLRELISMRRTLWT